MFAEIDATGWAVIIGAIFLGVFKVVEMILTYKRERDKAERDRIVAAKVEQVAVKQEIDGRHTKEQLDGMAKVGRKTHDLANSAMLEQKRMHAEKCRAMAKMEPTPVNISEANAAEESYQKHKEGQEKSDAKEAGQERVKAEQHAELTQAVEAVPGRTVDLIDERSEGG